MAETLNRGVPVGGAGVIYTDLSSIFRILNKYKKSRVKSVGILKHELAKRDIRIAYEPRKLRNPRYQQCHDQANAVRKNL